MVLVISFYTLQKRWPVDRVFLPNPLCSPGSHIFHCLCTCCLYSTQRARFRRLPSSYACLERMRACSTVLVTLNKWSHIVSQLLSSKGLGGRIGRVLRFGRGGSRIRSSHQRPPRTKSQCGQSGIICCIVFASFMALSPSKTSNTVRGCYLRVQTAPLPAKC